MYVLVLVYVLSDGVGIFDEAGSLPAWPAFIALARTCLGDKLLLFGIAYGVKNVLRRKQCEIKNLQYSRVKCFLLYCVHAIARVGLL